MLYNYIHVFKMQHVTSATSPGTGKGGHGDGYIAIHLYFISLHFNCSMRLPRHALAQAKEVMVVK